MYKGQYMKFFFVLIAVFAAGSLCGYQFASAMFVTDTPVVSSSLPPTVSQNAQVQPATASSISAVDSADKDSIDELVKYLSVQTPKTQFEGYRAFQKLDQLSAEDIERILLNLDDSQMQLRAQIAWFLTGKFPENAFALMESSMSDNQMALAKALFTNLTTNHPEKVFDWLQNNENDYAILFPVVEQQFGQKMILFQTLSTFPDWKWVAYEAGRKLAKESVRSEDKWGSRKLAQSAAQANPQEAINYALAQHSGAVDGALLNGALVEYAKVNPEETKNLLLENQSYVDEYTVGAVIDNLLFRGQFEDAYNLAGSLQDKKIAESVVGATAAKMHDYGSEKVIDFVATITDSKLKVAAISSAINSMSVAGYPIEKQLEIMDGSLHEVAAAEKAFQYAWTLKNGYKNNPQSMEAYMGKLKFNNKELAAEVEKVLGYLKDS